MALRRPEPHSAFRRRAFTVLVPLLAAHLHTPVCPHGGGLTTPFEFVLIFLMGGVIILTTMDDDHSVTNSTMGVITIGIMHRPVALIRQRFHGAAAIIGGETLVLLKDAQWQKEAMEGAAIADDDVMAAARTKGLHMLHAIKYAILERNGAISIIRNKQ